MAARDAVLWTPPQCAGDGVRCGAVLSTFYMDWSAHMQGLIVNHAMPLTVRPHLGRKRSRG